MIPKTIVRQFASSSRLGIIPRFTTTLTEASKPPLEKPHVISRPFGLEKPTLLNKAGSNIASFNIFELFFSADAKERRQKQLDHDIKHSPFYETKSFNNTKGKIFTPPISYFKPDVSKMFPDLFASTLLGEFRKLSSTFASHVNIVRIYSTVSGTRCADSYFTVDGKQYLTSDYDSFKEQHPLTQIIDINMPQNWMKGFMVKLSLGNIRKLIPKLRHENYFVVPNHILPYDVKQKLHCDNSCSGYIYVLDQEGRIRWATSGTADDKELLLMWKCIKGLENELKKDTEVKAEAKADVPQ